MRCCGCGADFPDITGPTHEYMLSSPGCWEAYGRILAREYENRAYAPLHRLSVDAYAVQHPGTDCPRARNSVGIHLSRLCLTVGSGWPVERANDVMLAITTRKRHYPWLIPPADRGAVTIQRVLETGDPSSHLQAVADWAKSAWEAWAEHHETVRRWVEGLR
jgi:hypothetical protein